MCILVGLLGLSTRELYPIGDDDRVEGDTSYVHLVTIRDIRSSGSFNITPIVSILKLGLLYIHLILIKSTSSIASLISS